MVFRSMDRLTLSSRCIYDYEVLQDQRQLPRPLGWSLHCVKGRVFANGGAFRKSGGIMDQTQAIWIKDPLAILADGAERGIVVRGRQDRRTGAARPGTATANATVYRRQRPRRAARLDQHPSSFLPDADPGAAGGARSRTVSVAAGALSGLGAADAGIARSRRHRGDVGVAAVGLHHHDRSSLRFPGRARGRHRYRGRRREAARHPRAADARLDESVADATAGCRPTAWCRTRTRSSPTANAWSQNTTSAARTRWCRSRWRHARRFR